MEAAPEVVFAHFTDPVRITEWIGRAATLDPCPGGLFRLEFDAEHTARGEYVEVIPPERLSFSSGFEEGEIAPGSSTVEVTLEPDGDGTLVRLRHSGLPDESMEGHDEGWGRYLTALADLNRKGDRG